MTNQHTQQDSSTSEALNRLRTKLNAKLEQKRIEEDAVRAHLDVCERLANDTAAMVISATDGLIPGVRVEPYTFGYAVFLKHRQVAAIRVPEIFPGEPNRNPFVTIYRVTADGDSRRTSGHSYIYHDAEGAAGKAIGYLLDV